MTAVTLEQSKSQDPEYANPYLNDPRFVRLAEAAEKRNMVLPRRLDESPRILEILEGLLLT